MEIAIAPIAVLKLALEGQERDVGQSRVRSQSADLDLKCTRFDCTVSEICLDQGERGGAEAELRAYGQHKPSHKFGLDKALQEFAVLEVSLD